MATGLLQRLQETLQNISNTETMKILKKSGKTTEELFQNNERIPVGFIEDEVENVYQSFSYCNTAKSRLSE